MKVNVCPTELLQQIKLPNLILTLLMLNEATKQEWGELVFVVGIFPPFDGNIESFSEVSK